MHLEIKNVFESQVVRGNINHTNDALWWKKNKLRHGPKIKDINSAGRSTFACIFCEMQNDT